jgi:hypothetical protein
MRRERSHALPLIGQSAKNANIVGALARLLLEPDPTAAISFVEHLQRRGLSTDTICLGLLEPVARCLGDWWSEDLCEEAQITIAMCHLQTLMRRGILAFGEKKPAACAPPRSALVVPQPCETHLLRLSLDLEYFSLAGWDAACAFPNCDEALGQLLRERWVDTLNISLSSVFRREHRLASLAALIRVARAASRNPALTVMVDGRIFLENPEYYVLVGADAACLSADRVAAVAESMVSAMQFPLFVAARDVFHSAGQRIAEKVLNRSRVCSSVVA